MRKLNGILNSKRKFLYTQIIAIFGLAAGSQIAMADCTLVAGNKLETNNTLYYCGNASSYDVVEIKTTDAGKISPLQGYGVYSHGGTLSNVLIQTTGMQADGIMQRNSTDLTINGNLEIDTSGYSADGINLAVTGASSLNIIGTTNITVGNGVAARANLSRASASGNKLSFSDRVYVHTTGAGENLSQGLGYGLYAGNRARESEGMPIVGSANIVATNHSEIETTGNAAYAVYANRTGTIQLADAQITTTGNSAHALVAEDGDVATGTYTWGGLVWTPDGNVQHYDGGQIYLTGDTQLTVDASKGSYAMYSSGQNALIASQSASGVNAPGVYTVTGNLVAERAGQINLQAVGASQFHSDLSASNAGSSISLNLADASQVTGDHLAQDSGVINLIYRDDSVGIGNMFANTNGAVHLNMGQDSRVNGNMTTDNTGVITATLDGNAYYTGTVDASAGGPITMNIVSNGAKWQLLNNSTITNLNFVNAGEVILGDVSNPDGMNRVDLVINNLSGSGHFYVRADINRDGLNANNDGDKIYITDSSSGSHTVYVRDANLGNAAVVTTGTEMLRIVEDNSGGDATFTLGGDAGTGIQQTYVDVGAYRYTLGQEENTTRASGPVYWSLQAAGGPTLTNLAQNAAGILNVNYLLGYVETQTLLQRMGELRSSDSQGDVWGRVYTGKLSSFDDPRLSAWDMDYYGVQAGIDRRLDVADGTVYVGVMAGTGKGDTSYTVGDGDTKSYHAGIYGTYQMDNGFYLDGILKYTYMRNNINTLTGGGYAVTGHGSSQGFSIGVEGGKRFYVVEPDQGWYVEPQAQLTYAHQDDATIHGSNGLRTDLEGYSSVQGRVSVIVGYEIAQGPNPVNLYLKTGYVREFDGKTGYVFNYVNRERYDFGGGWWDNGIGVNAQIAERHNLYMDATYSRGGSFDRKQFNIGYRYSF